MTRLLTTAILFTVVSSLAIPPVCFSGNTITMATITRNIDNYNAFLAEKDQSFLEVDNLESEHSNRNVACMVIIMQALHLGGYPADVQFIAVPNYARELEMVASGNAVIMHQDAWGISHNEHLYMSSPIIASGMFAKGFFVKEERVGEFRITSLHDLEQLTCVSSRNWGADWLTLEKIPFARLDSVKDKETMFRLVLNRGIDLTPQEFGPGKDMAYAFEGQRLVPVPGVKLALAGSRHIMVSRVHKDGKQVFEALERGLAILRERGTIDRFLTEAGFFREETRDWLTLRVE